MNFTESLFADSAVSSPYPAMYSQGQRYRDIQSMLQPQYSAMSPADLYNQSRFELDSLAAPSTPSRGFSPGAPPQSGNSAASPQAAGLLSGPEGGLGQGSAGPGGSMGSLGNMGFGGITAAGLGMGLLGVPGLSTATTMGLLGMQGVDPSVALGYSLGFNNQMDVVVNAMNNVTPSVEAGLGIGAGFTDNDAANFGFGTPGSVAAAMSQSDAQAAENAAQGMGGGVGDGGIGAAADAAGIGEVF